MKLTDYLGDKPFWRVTARLALPVALQNVLTSSFQLVDTMMVSRLGDVTLSAVGMAAQWGWLCNLLNFGLCSGMSVFISQYWGVKWFSGGTSAMIMLMIASIWQNFGINMLFFMTGLQAIPPEMYEAASIDGASNTRQFLTITIPLLGPVLQMVLMNAILGSLKVTDLVLTLTNGKPSGKTEVMMTYIYKKFFGDGGASGLDFGYGAALTVVTAVILGIVTLLYLRATKKSSDVY